MRYFLLSICLFLSGCSSIANLTFSSSQSSSSTGFNIGSSSGSSSGPVADPTYVAMWDGYRDSKGGYTGADLTRLTLRELDRIDQSFFGIVPRDAHEWCPAFARQSNEGRKAFYLGFISGIARFETDFRAHVKYLEAGGHYSRGLLQLGQLALSYYPDSQCDVSGDPRQLHDLQKNLSCGTMLVEYWVRRDNHIASDGNIGDADGRYFGAARYWSTLREGRRGHDEIMEFTRSLPVCQR